MLTQREIEIVDCLVAGWVDGGMGLYGHLSYQDVIDFLTKVGADASTVLPSLAEQLGVDVSRLRPVKRYYCTHCRYEGDENEFRSNIPTSSVDARFCPKCSSLNVMIAEQVK